MTRPNTLAALPSSQYPTLLLLVSGKNGLAAGVAVCAAIDWPRLLIAGSWLGRFAVDTRRVLA